jgi:hypothetical protein
LLCDCHDQTNCLYMIRISNQNAHNSTRAGNVLVRVFTA